MKRRGKDPSAASRLRMTQRKGAAYGFRRNHRSIPFDELRNAQNNTPSVPPLHKGGKGEHKQRLPPSKRGEKLSTQLTDEGDELRCAHELSFGHELRQGERRLRAQKRRFAEAKRRKGFRITSRNSSGCAWRRSHLRRRLHRRTGSRSRRSEPARRSRRRSRSGSSRGFPLRCA